MEQLKPWSFDIAIDFDEYESVFGKEVMYPWQAPYLFGFIGAVVGVSKLLELAGCSQSVNLFSMIWMQLKERQTLFILI